MPTLQVPIAEFDLLTISLSPATATAESVAPLDGPLTFVVTEGAVTIRTEEGDSLTLTRGQAGFVAANSQLAVETASNAETAELWGAFYQ